MKKRNLVLVILAIMLVFGLVVSCDGDPAADDPNAAAKLSSVTAVGDPTTSLTIAFTKDVTGLTADDITLAGEAAPYVKITNLTGSGKSWSATIDEPVGGGSLTVNVKGYDSKTATIKFKAVYSNFLQKFYCKYSGTLTETVDITKTLIKFSDNAATPVDFINFAPSKWEKTTIPVQTAWTGYDGNVPNDTFYTVGVKVIGKITDGKEKSSTKLYGSVTCPGLTEADINTTEVSIYLYITEETDKLDTYLARSAFFGGTTGSPQNPLASTNRREYKVNDQDD
jgi:hypothetical protein